MIYKIYFRQVQTLTIACNQQFPRPTLQEQLCPVLSQLQRAHNFQTKMRSSNFPLCITSLILFAFSSSISIATDTLVDLGYSKYQGRVVGDGTTQWLGIRYAAPPLGELRFAAPRLPGNREGVQDATKVSTTVIGSFFVAFQFSLFFSGRREYLKMDRLLVGRSLAVTDDYVVRTNMSAR
jgi:hypothetical protein